MEEEEEEVRSDAKRKRGRKWQWRWWYWEEALSELADTLDCARESIELFHCTSQPWTTLWGV